MVFLSIIFGCLLAFGVSFFLIIYIAYTLNDNGKCKGNFNDFASTPLVIKNRTDNIKKNSSINTFMYNEKKDSFISMIKDSLEVSDGNPFDNHYFH